MLSGQTSQAPKYKLTQVIWLFYGFRGGIGRWLYWLSIFAYLLALVGLRHLASLLWFPSPEWSPWIMVAFPSIFILAFWPQISLMGKRLQDAGYNGMFAWLAAVFG